MMWIVKMARTILIMQSIRMPYGTRLNEYLLLLALIPFYMLCLVPHCSIVQKPNALKSIVIMSHYYTIICLTELCICVNTILAVTML